MSKGVDWNNQMYPGDRLDRSVGCYPSQSDEDRSYSTAYERDERQIDGVLRREDELDTIVPRGAPTSSINNSFTRAPSSQALT